MIKYKKKAKDIVKEYSPFESVIKLEGSMIQSTLNQIRSKNKGKKTGKKSMEQRGTYTCME